MSKRALDGLKLPPTTRREMERMLRDLQHEPELTPEQRVAFDQQVEQTFPGGFDRRDEANALVAMAGLGTGAGGSARSTYGEPPVCFGRTAPKAAVGTSHLPLRLVRSGHPAAGESGGIVRRPSGR
jgi:hypothetical protein